ncbi:esterase family protein [Candidatus Palauibacter sp.]|uniref:esterase family protein n=1 Tax=Candidatus Palauibacter sp. TaxID=3101350 RepID=UPI003B5AC9F2
MKLMTSWWSDGLEQEVNVVRWGEVGVPLLMFPTAGGDAEEIERFLVIDTVADFLADGRIKVYSCDSVAGRVMLGQEGTPEHRMRVLNAFQNFVYYELVPMIRDDCNDPSIEVMAAGSSIGAFNALAMLCRFPDAFSHALCMSGTYDLLRFLKHETGIEAGITGDFYYSSPLHYLPDLTGETLDLLRERFVLLASGRGRAEDIDESWRMASLLGRKGVPNRMDDWGETWHHDWPTWRNMLVRYLDELLPPR